MIIAAVCMVVNIVFNLLLMGPFLHVGLAMATVISAWTNTLLLATILRQRGQLTRDERFKSRLPRILLSAALMGGVLWGLTMILAPWIGNGETQRIAALVILIAAGLISYFLLAHVTGAARLSDIKGMLRKKAS